jgi:hypothetical protein
MCASSVFLDRAMNGTHILYGWDGDGSFASAPAWPESPRDPQSITQSAVPPVTAQADVSVLLSFQLWALHLTRHSIVECESTPQESLRTERIRTRDFPRFSEIKGILSLPSKASSEVLRDMLSGK